MKIAAKTSLATFAAFVGMGVCMFAVGAQAQSMAGSGVALPPGILSPTSASSSPSTPQAQPSAAPAQVPSPVMPSPGMDPAAYSAAAMAKIAPTSAVGGNFPAAASGGNGAATGINVSSGSADVKIPESVKNVVKKLTTDTQNVTVEDLNDARQAVAKLDLLLDIEKRMSDLAALRADREEKKSAANNLAGAIPASALGLGGKMPSNAPPQLMELMKSMGMAPAEQKGPEKEVEKPQASIDVDRIIGAGGHYVALVRVGPDKVKHVKVGDKLSDGSVVESISSNGVVLSDSKKGQRTVKVRDVTTIFGAH